LKAYLGELPGYDPTMPLDKQKGDEPSKQHGFAQFYFTATFTQLAVSLGHIFRCEMGDIDMRDIVLNRRILVVNLPAPENSDATLAALGKLVVASLRGMMAQLLGASLEGDYTEADKPGMGPSPFPVVLDRASGVAETMLRGAGLSILADRDEALAETVIVEPPVMSTEVLEMHIKAVVAQLGKLRSAANLKRAA
jgi:intracellular multiplication protein IcmO